jgi:hypothetical protein
MCGYFTYENREHLKLIRNLNKVLQLKNNLGKQITNQYYRKNKSQVVKDLVYKPCKLQEEKREGIYNVEARPDYMERTVNRFD